ncbi:MAG TPA: LuxR family transcriptional regulator [Gemmatimonadaceae bacterium]|nr:LuxR family transcriptional regulator [Gemmatimonadaceae bacterium]
MPELHRRPVLHGRRMECEELDRLLASVQEGHSRVLVVRGEAGVGKTAMLSYLAERASDFRIVRATGVESEMELAFAGVHQLCAPLLGRLTRLPVPHGDAVRTAFGLSAGHAPDLFLVGLGVLGLLADVAGDGPLLCLVEDTQWLDRASAQVLGFVARRLLAEPVAMIFAIRSSNGESELRNIPVMVLDGLSETDALALLGAATPGRLDERVRDRIVAEANGNPLALLELPKGLTAAKLAGGFGRPDARPVANRVEQSFLHRVRALPVETQRFLLAAAADPVGDAPLLWRAAEVLGINVDAAMPAVADGLIELGARVRFRHPLARSAAYRAAAVRKRREIHRALAEVTDASVDPDRRAWHRAQASLEPDETVASELERSADRAQGRGGIAAAAAFLERATNLTPDPSQRGVRALAAAQAKFAAGDANAAHELLAAAEISPLDDLQRARLIRLRARIAFAERRGSDAPQRLLDAARGLEGLDNAMAHATYLEAFAAAIFAGRLSGPIGIRQVAEAARTAPPAKVSHRPTDLLMHGLATRFLDGYAASVPALRRALQAIAAEEGDGEKELRWMWLTSPIAFEVWDEAAWDQLTLKAIAVSRASGALADLRVALAYRAGVSILTGDFATASVLLEESDAISSATGLTTAARYAWDLLAAWQGDEDRVLRTTGADVRDATERGEGRVIGLAGHVTALLYNGLGRYQAAFAAAQRACEYDDPGLFGWYLAELIEAASRSDAAEAAREALHQLEARTRPAGTNWALGILARSSALLSTGSAADALYLESIERLGRSRLVVHLARAHLLYGEWLRRENRRVDARAQLRYAFETFSRMGAAAFAERARRELLATGETVRKRASETLSALTAQEALVARLAAQGRTNPEIGAQLFISSRTAEYHLRKVFTKLGITSRRSLRDALGKSQLVVSPT